jgi:hypothetical protein
LPRSVAEVRRDPLPHHRQDRDVTVDEAIEQFLIEHLLGEKGREPRTVDDYRRLHLKWFATEIGRRRVRDVDEAAIDRIFGKMQRAGLSRSRMNHARSLYAPFSTEPGAVHPRLDETMRCLNQHVAMAA